MRLLVRSPHGCRISGGAMRIAYTQVQQRATSPPVCQFHWFTDAPTVTTVTSNIYPIDQQYRRKHFHPSTSVVGEVAWWVHARSRAMRVRYTVLFAEVVLPHIFAGFSEMFHRVILSHGRNASR